MSNFAADIEEAAGDEAILGIVVRQHDWHDDDDDDDEYLGIEAMKPYIPKEARGIVVPWMYARPWLDREYDTGFGGAECWAIYAWTPTRVLFVDVYDGATSIQSVPRNPIACRPTMPGGG